jgi:protein-disulfide isomerase
MTGSPGTPTTRVRARVALAIFAAAAVIGLLQAGARWFQLPGERIDSSFDVRQLVAGSRSPAIPASPSAPAIVVFTDYQCAICRADERELRSIYGNPPGRVLFKEWAILGPASRSAARLALAAAYQRRYLDARHALMTAANIRDESAQLRALGLAGLDLPLLIRDLERHGSEIDLELAAVSRQAFSLGLQGTPAYLVGSRLVKGSLSARQLQRIRAAEADSK